MRNRFAVNLSVFIVCCSERLLHLLVMRYNHRCHLASDAGSGNRLTTKMHGLIEACNLDAYMAGMRHTHPLSTGIDQRNTTQASLQRGCHTSLFRGVINWPLQDKRKGQYEDTNRMFLVPRSPRPQVLDGTRSGTCRDCVLPAGLAASVQAVSVVRPVLQPADRPEAAQHATLFRHAFCPVFKAIVKIYRLQTFCNRKQKFSSPQK